MKAINFKCHDMTQSVLQLRTTIKKITIGEYCVTLS